MLPTDIVFRAMLPAKHGSMMGLVREGLVWESLQVQGLGFKERAQQVMRANWLERYCQLARVF